MRKKTVHIIFLAFLIFKTGHRLKQDESLIAMGKFVVHMIESISFITICIFLEYLFNLKMQSIQWQ